MDPRLQIDTTLPTPIWSQIEEGIRHRVASGSLAAGSALPSVRDLAREHRINPNTVAKAYQRLATAGVVEARRGQGTFVVESPPALSASVRAKLLRDGAERFVGLAVTIGASAADARQAVASAWPSRERRGERS
jgi:GntR family transcriptional regulator